MAPLRSGEPARPRGARQPLASASSRRVAQWARALTLVSAALVAAGGYVHFCLYRHGYRSIPTIGPAFVLQFTSSAAIAIALVLGSWGARDGRGRALPGQLARLAGIGLAVGTLVALAIAHTSNGLFGFREFGLRPAPQTLITILVEYDAAMLLAIAMILGRVSGRHAHAALHETRPSGSHLSDAA